MTKLRLVGPAQAAEMREWSDIKQKITEIVREALATTAYDEEYIQEIISHVEKVYLERKAIRDAFQRYIPKLLTFSDEETQMFLLLFDKWNKEVAYDEALQKVKRDHGVLPEGEGGA